MNLIKVSAAIMGREVPSWPWFLTGVTTPFVLQSTESGSGPPLTKYLSPSCTGRLASLMRSFGVYRWQHITILIDTAVLHFQLLRSSTKVWSSRSDCFWAPSTNGSAEGEDLYGLLQKLVARVGTLVDWKWGCLSTLQCSVVLLETKPAMIFD